MATNKVITNHATTHSAMKSCIAYVLRSDKVKEGYVAMVGPYRYKDINVNNVVQTFIDEKQLWNKDSGRMYMHSIVSWHKDENITPQQALDFATELVENDVFYSKYQSLVGVHQDKDHIHAHIVTNTVSYIDGAKEHHTKKQLEAMMARSNGLCKMHGFTVTEKGRHFNGTVMDAYDVSSMKNNKYRVVGKSSTQSYLVECMTAVDAAKDIACSRDEFIALMQSDGWTTHWSDNRKYITFEDESGHKVRNVNLSKTFNINLDKEFLINEFKRNAECDIGTDESDSVDGGASLGNSYELSAGIAATTYVAIEASSRTARKLSNKSRNEQQKKAARL